MVCFFPRVPEDWIGFVLGSRAIINVEHAVSPWKDFLAKWMSRSWRDVVEMSEP